jgi:hypothetical protein
LLKPDQNYRNDAKSLKERPTSPTLHRGGEKRSPASKENQRLKMNTSSEALSARSKQKGEGHSRAERRDPPAVDFVQVSPIGDHKCDYHYYNKRSLTHVTPFK